MAIRSKQNRCSIVLSSSTTTPSPDKPATKRFSLIGSRPKSVCSPTSRQSNQHDQALVDQLKSEGPHQIQQIKAHLKLIESFDVLIQLSQQSLVALNSAHQNDPSVLENRGQITNRQDLEEIFYHLILFRFELWLGRVADHLPQSLFKFNSNHQEDVTNLTNSDDDYEIELNLDYLPPLDVLFVWYCYCFNSRNYYEDSLRLYPILKHLRFPLELAASAYDCSCASTNFEKLKSITKLENPEEAEALMKKRRTPASAESSSESQGHEDLENPSSLAPLLLPKNFNSQAGSNSHNLWLSMTNTNFNIIDFIHQPSFRTFICPLCDDTIESPFYVIDPQTNLVEVSDICWSYSSEPQSTSQDAKPNHDEIQEETPTDKGTVNAKHKNQAKLNCPNCNWIGTKQDLSIFKFANELKSCLSNTTSEKSGVNDSDSAPIDSLAGTLTTTQNLNDKGNTVFFNKLFLQDQNNSIYKHFNERSTSDTTLDCLHTLKKVQNSLKLKLLTDDSVSLLEKSKMERSFNNLLRSYSVPEPFSVDLIRTMKIQRLFIKRMVKLGWTEVYTQEEKSVTFAQKELDYRLQSCISRYKAFSNLLSTTQFGLILIPTSDIDLAWKTDRLRGFLYAQSVMRDNKIMMDHPEEFDFDRSKFLDQFRLTSALWIHRYQLEYSRYPAPFVKTGRRQNWLKKALANITSLPETNSGSEDQHEDASAQQKYLDHIKATQQQTQKFSTTEDIHSKPGTQPNPSISSSIIGGDQLSSQKHLADLNSKIGLPIEPVKTGPEFEESRQSEPLAESTTEPATTPDTQLFEHKTAQISIASYFENIYTANDSFAKSSMPVLRVEQSKHFKPNLDREKQNQQSQLEKQVAQGVGRNSTVSVETLYCPSSCPSSAVSALEHETSSGSHSTTTKPDPGVIHQARKVSIKFADDVKKPNSPITKLYTVTERLNVQKKYDESKGPITPKPLPQTNLPPIRFFPLDSPVSRHENNHELIDESLIEESVNQKRTESARTNYPIEQRLEARPKMPTIKIMLPEDQRQNNQDTRKLNKLNPIELQLKKDKRVNFSTSHDNASENLHKSRILKSNEQASQRFKQNDPYATSSHVMDDRFPADLGFFEIPIGKIAFVEDGNILRCL